MRLYKRFTVHLLSFLYAPLLHAETPGSKKPEDFFQSVARTKISIKMAIQDNDLKVPNAPHGVTSNIKTCNDWPNDAGVCRSIFRRPCRLSARLILFPSSKPSTKKQSLLNSECPERSRHMRRRSPLTPSEYWHIQCVH